MPLGQMIPMILILTLTLLTALRGEAALASGEGSNLVEREVSYNFLGRKFRGHIVLPEKFKNGAGQGILLVHDWMGVTETTLVQARRWAREGYAVFAADIYGANDRPKNQAEAASVSSVFKRDRTLFRVRLRAGLEQMEKQTGLKPNRIAALGYCFGGTGVIELARSGADIPLVISFHGGLDSPKPEDGARIKARVVAFHGADDPFVSDSDIRGFEREMQTSKIDWQLVKLGRAVHSFTDRSAGTDPSKGAAFSAVADERSFVAARYALTETWQKK